jgi:lipoyl(octanoyl) transferase
MMLWVSQIGSTEYQAAFDLQRALREARREGKIENLFLLTSHPPVFTLGRRECGEDFLSSPQVIQKEGIEVAASNRGGRVTYHGPGQIVGYFIFDIRSLKLGIPEFVRKIEEALIRSLAVFEIEAHRDPEHPGVWRGHNKLGALGLHFDRGISIHGFALNVSPNLDHYRHIVACGIEGRGVSSLEKELGRSIEVKRVEEVLIEKLGEVFEMKVKKIPKDEITRAGLKPTPTHK